MSSSPRSPDDHDDSDLLDEAEAEINKICKLIEMARECQFRDVEKKLHASLRAACTVLRLMESTAAGEPRERIAALCRQIDARLAQ